MEQHDACVKKDNEPIPRPTPTHRNDPLSPYPSTNPNIPIIPINSRKHQPTTAPPHTLLPHTHYSHSHHVEATTETRFSVATLLEDTAKTAGSGPLAHRPFFLDDSLARLSASSRPVEPDFATHS